MISDPDVAKQVSDLMLEIHRRLGESLQTVRRICPSGDYAAYNRAIGKIVSRIVFDVVEPLYEEHPNLKPPGWDDWEPLA